jgi:hypothetical protein
MATRSLARSSLMALVPLLSAGVQAAGRVPQADIADTPGVHPVLVTIVEGRAPWPADGAARTPSGVAMPQTGAGEEPEAVVNPWLLGIGGFLAVVFVVARRATV